MTRGVDTVLVVEDNPDHALLVRIAARRAFPDLDVRVVGDGREAVSYLGGTRPFEDRAENPFPRLVILDLVMPGLDGFGVLSWMRATDVPKVRRVPVVVLTSSVNPGDEARALQMGAVAFFTKPASLDELGRTVSSIVERWLR